MHDPQTVAFEIKYPWYEHAPWPKKYRKEIARGFNPREAFGHMTAQEQAGRSSMWPGGYRSSFITIWHVDPERDGSDDSCGWSYPKLTDKQRERLKNAAWGEGRTPYFLRCREKEWRGTRTEAEALYRGLVLLVADVIGIKIGYDEAARIAARTIHQPDCCDQAGAFCYLPGYHTNSKDEETEGPPYEGITLQRRQDRFFGVMGGVASDLLRRQRPWYRHPKWHLWHWKIQCHPIQQFKRWAFSRCETCGRGFKYGESPVSSQWDSDGPKWFRGERHVQHMNCSGHAVATTAQ